MLVFMVELFGAQTPLNIFFILSYHKEHDKNKNMLAHIYIDKADGFDELQKMKTFAIPSP